MKKYVKVYNSVKKDIVNKNLLYGEKLPSKRNAAFIFGVSVITVERAYAALASEGYIDSKEKSGYFVTYSPDMFTVKRGKTEENFNINKLSLKEEEKNAVGNEAEEYFPFSVYASAVRAVLNDYGESLMKRTDGSGAKVLKTAIKNYLKVYKNIETAEKNIIIGAGAEYLYGLIVELIGKNKVFAVETPSYGGIKKTYLSMGMKVEELALRADGIDSGELERSRADVLHVTPYKSYPTMISATASKRAEYLRHVCKTGGYIVEDDYESEFSNIAKPTETLFGEAAEQSENSDKKARVIYVNTFTKTICPSVRVAYMILPGDLADEYYKKFGFRSCPVPSLEQYVVAKILSDGSFIRHINRVRRTRRQNRQ
mgnify:FL=1